MSRVTVIGCNWEGCQAIEREERSKIDGRLTVGGNKRGCYRTDLCPVHARRVIQVAEQALAKKRKKR